MSIFRLCIWSYGVSAVQIFFLLVVKIELCPFCDPITRKMSVLYPMKNYAVEPYHIYAYFDSGNRAGGSVLIDCAKTEEEANEKKAEHERALAKRSHSERGYVYVMHQSDWWMD
jgi:hypothetical protein